MAEETTDLNKIATTLSAKDELTRTTSTLELLWNGANLYYTKTSQGGSITDGDIMILKEAFYKLFRTFVPILKISEDEFHTEKKDTTE